MSNFIHLHNHSHYSLLDGACRIPDLVRKAVENDMSAISLTDHGNMFGAIQFYQKCHAENVKPLVGAEAYIAPGSRFEKSKAKGQGKPAFHVVLLAKDDTGYKNLIKLISAGYTEGFYYKPRIDHELLRQHADGLIAMSACLKGEVPFTYLREGYDAALEKLNQYLDVFGDDFYLEVQDHGIPEEREAAEGIFKLAEETGTKVVLTNDIHYLERDHWEAHDILLCLQTGSDFDDPKRMRYNTHELYFKTEKEMATLYPDHPEILTNTLEVAEKCDLKMKFREYKMPNFEIPAESKAEKLEDYLTELAEQGLEERYDEVTPELRERLHEELQVINGMGFPGYFLITADFINWAKDNGIPVGPGRGSAAGSLVAYCTKITDLDPIGYDLYFERFLNPERVSMPDIDIDFCYVRREEVIEYTKQTYGYDAVCQIITFGTMASRSVVRDVGRVLKLSYAEVDRIAKLIPATSKSLKAALEDVQELKDLINSNESYKRLWRFSQVLEGLARHSSTHAAGVVIAPGDLTDYIPLYKTKEGDVTTQFEMNNLDDAGMLKMDFLGLRTLTVIYNAVASIKKHGQNIDIDKIPLDDPDVYKLFGEGRTVGVFQFESSGMQEYMKKLKPSQVEDLIAMNALYRPGPMDNIDEFINRKYGRKETIYLHPKLEPILKNTYGIIVYQEQVMKAASELAGYTLGGADILRRAMGKKKKEEMDKQRGIFIKGCKETSDISEQKAVEIFSYIEQFAKYGFNKAHAACYSVVAYQTAYLKVHFPAEFMAATISSEMGSSDRVTILLDECQRMSLQVLPPDVNESCADFVVHDQGIRFGLGAVKNVGTGAIEAIVKAREEGGPFKTIFELVKRADSSAVNSKVLESLIEAGALDGLKGTRAELFQAVDTANEFAQRLRKSNTDINQASLFDMSDESEIELPDPPMPENVDEWSNKETLDREKAVLGFYLSGHPLDDFKQDMNTFSTISLNNSAEFRDGMPVRLCALVSDIKFHTDRKKRPMAFLKLEDMHGAIEAIAFSDPFEKYRHLLIADSMVVLNGKINIREGRDPSLIINDILTLEDARGKFTKNLCIVFDPQKLESDTMNDVHKILQESQGNIPVYISLRANGKGSFLLKSKSITVDPTMELLETLRKRIGRENVWIS